MRTPCCKQETLNLRRIRFFYKPLTPNPMVTVQLKIVEEGLKHPIDELTHFLRLQLLEDDILVNEGSNLSLKIKFTREGEQDIILLQLRESATKNKLDEKIIPYLEYTWLEDISAESHALLSRTSVLSE